ncbi:hypothetical protein GDO81_025798 [Engystomops pustulosus]|uniref:Uncharacterized protein n=1 Tax=Engystomops pustulosus TaxID=76066 RepID=A0AAV6YGX2_ENGPU|nr:hypothetical protein GDO81_025798 [Engystomops pustulosus]
MMFEHRCSIGGRGLLSLQTADSFFAPFMSSEFDAPIQNNTLPALFSAGCTGCLGGAALQAPAAPSRCRCSPEQATALRATGATATAPGTGPPPPPTRGQRTVPGPAGSPSLSGLSDDAFPAPSLLLQTRLVLCAMMERGFAISPHPGTESTAGFVLGWATGPTRQADTAARPEGTGRGRNTRFTS